MFTEKFFRQTHNDSCTVCTVGTKGLWLMVKLSVCFFWFIVWSVIGSFFHLFSEEGMQRHKNPWNETDLDSYERKPHHTYDSKFCCTIYIEYNNDVNAQWVFFRKIVLLSSKPGGNIVQQLTEINNQRPVLVHLDIFIEIECLFCTYFRILNYIKQFY